MENYNFHLRDNSQEDIEDELVWELVHHITSIRRNPRVFRLRTDHFFKWSEDEFFDRFRISKKTAKEVIDLLYLRPKTKRSYSVTKEEMFLLTLRFYAAGSMLVVIGDFSGVHKSTASRVIAQVSLAIARLAGNYIKLPQNSNQLREVQLGFYNIAKFPKCVGALDCTHIKIQSPGGDDAELFRNRKGYFSMNVQCICDSSLRITNIVCRWPGSAHDSTIFNMSRVRSQFENGEFRGSLLVGDSGYPLKSYLLTPLSNPISPEEHLYNESHIRTRNTIERCFGVWKRRFPILSLGIRLKREKIELIVVATAVLHNIASKNGDPTPSQLDSIPEEMPTFNTGDASNNNSTSMDSNTRVSLVNYFSSF